jgi:uncharacterized membrane protein
MMHPMYGGIYSPFRFFGFPIFGSIFGILLLALAVYVTVLIVKKIKNSSAGVRDDEALLIAKRRYARGEITEGEYKQLVEDLTKL